MTALGFIFYWTLQIAKARTNNHSPWQWFSSVLRIYPLWGWCWAATSDPGEAFTKQSTSESGEQLHWSQGQYSGSSIYLGNQASLSKFFYWCWVKRGNNITYLLGLSWELNGLTAVQYTALCLAHSRCLLSVSSALTSCAWTLYLKLGKIILSIFQHFYKCVQFYQLEAIKSHHSTMFHIPYETQKSVINTFKLLDVHISLNKSPRKNISSCQIKFFLNFITSISSMQRGSPFFPQRKQLF